MSHDDFIGLVEEYLATFDGVTPLPDRVRDAIRAELPSAPQVRPRVGLERVFTMLSNASAGARLGLAAAAVVAVVVLGAAILDSNRSGGIVGTSATPNVTPAQTGSSTTAPTASPAPSVAAGPPTLDRAPVVPCAPTSTDTCGAAGTYQLNNRAGPTTWPVMVTIDEPAGWFNWDAGAGWDALLVNKGRGASGWGVMFYTVGDVARDPCDSTKGSTPAAQVDTPQKLAAAMAAWPHFTATAPQPITVDGHAGLEFQLASSKASTCTGSGIAGRSASGADVDAYPMVNDVGAHDTATVEIVDTGHGLLVIRATDFPQTSPAELSGGIALDPTRHASDLSDLHAIIASIRLGASPTSP